MITVQISDEDFSMRELYGIQLCYIIGLWTVYISAPSEHLMVFNLRRYNQKLKYFCMNLILFEIKWVICPDNTLQRVILY